MSDITKIQVNGVDYDVIDSVTPRSSQSASSTYSDTGTVGINGVAVCAGMKSEFYYKNCISNTTTAKSVAKSTNVSLGSFSLPTGTWIIIGHVQMSATSSPASIRLTINTSATSYSCATAASTAAGTANLRLRNVFLASHTGDKTYYMTVYQTGSGTASTARYGCQAIRVG